MVLRNIVKIDEERCNGCGECVDACAEGAIEVIGGKAKLVSETYCDGLGACLGQCPRDAITVEQREADAFDEKATEVHLAKKKSSQPPCDFVCPGVLAKSLRDKGEATAAGSGSGATESASRPSQLGHWPVQLKLVSPEAACFAKADLLLAADCVGFAMADFHERLLKDHSLVVGCPKLDDSQFYVEKLAEIIKGNQLSSLTVVHMEVPCCSGLTYIAKEAIARSGIELSFEDITVDLRGNVVRTENIET